MGIGFKDTVTMVIKLSPNQLINIGATQNKIVLCRVVFRALSAIAMALSILSVNPHRHNNGCWSFFGPYSSPLFPVLVSSKCNRPLAECDMSSRVLFKPPRGRTC